MLVVRFNPNHSYSILTRQKQQVRLGEGEFDDEEITPEAIDRTCLVCRKFVDLARTFSTLKSLSRSPPPQPVRPQTRTSCSPGCASEAHIDVRVISGLEEARLIYLGVSSGLHLGDRQAFFIDIGGGSTEISLGGQQQFAMLESFRLGAITAHQPVLFRESRQDPCVPDQYKLVQQYVKNAIIHTIQKIQKQKIDLAVGSSGSIMNLADIAAKALHPEEGVPVGVLTYRDLKKAIDLLCALPLEERRKVPGINAERADIIIAGAVILDTFMKELSLESIDHHQPRAPGRYA